MSKYIYCFDPEIATYLIDKKLILLNEKIISGKKCWIFKCDNDIISDVPLNKAAIVITNKMFF